MSLRIGIVGTGTTVSIGNAHVNGFASDSRAKITAVYNRTFKRSEDFIAEHSLDAVACHNFDEMLSQVDGVVICTPNDSHAEYASLALSKGVAVLLEKPISNSIKETEKLIDIVKSSDAFSMVGYTNRFSNQVEMLKQIIEDRMTKIFHISITYGGERCANPNTAYEWRMNKAISGAGALIDYGSHAFDLVRYICNVKIKSVFCNLSTFIPTRKDVNGTTHNVDNDDIANINGCGVSFCKSTSKEIDAPNQSAEKRLCKADNHDDITIGIVCSRVGFSGCTITVVGDGGTIKAKIKDTKIEYIEKDIDGGYSGNSTLLQSKEMTQFGTFKGQATAFIDGILSIKNPKVCSIQDGYVIEKILEACFVSNETRRMIDVNLDEKVQVTNK